MKHLKRFVENPIELIKKLNKTKESVSYYYNAMDDTVTVDGDVNISELGLTEIPVKFKKVTGSFAINQNKLTSYKNCPAYVGGNFYGYNNPITTLEGGPEYVGGSYSCFDTLITDLEGAPERINGTFACIRSKLKTLRGGPAIVLGDFDCRENKITSLEYGPEIVKGSYSCSSNLLRSLEGAPKVIGENGKSSYGSVNSFRCNDNYLKNLDYLPKMTPEMGLSAHNNLNKRMNIFKSVTYEFYLHSAWVVHDNKNKLATVNKSIGIFENNQASLQIADSQVFKDLVKKYNLIILPVTPRQQKNNTVLFKLPHRALYKLSAERENHYNPERIYGLYGKTGVIRGITPDEYKNKMHVLFRLGASSPVLNKAEEAGLPGHGVRNAEDIVAMVNRVEKTIQRVYIETDKAIEVWKKVLDEDPSKLSTAPQQVLQKYYPKLANAAKIGLLD